MSVIKIVDPVTRIEGHMRVEVSIEAVNGAQQVIDAHCTGTLFRGFEKILKGRDPWDAPVLTQRICGVCPISHGLASVLALENASGFRPTHNARLLRNLTQGANFLQSHILHFYLLALFDFAAGPAASPWVPAWNVDLRGGLDGVTPHLVQAIEMRRHAHEMGAVFGGRMPTSHAFVPGGFTANATSARISTFRTHLNRLVEFIQNIYLPDAQAIGRIYPDYYSIGSGSRNLLAFGVFPTSDANGSKLLAPGYIERAGTEVQTDMPNQAITEHVKYSWYQDSTTSLSPVAGLTEPLYPKSNAYSWLKAPRLYDQPFETGALARMWVNGDYRRGISVMDRHVARAQEALKLGQAMQGWLNELDGSAAYNSSYVQASGFGVGLSEAPRGALGHWVQMSGRSIDHYQVITPTCWNCSPRDDHGVLGPVEQALVGIRVQDPAKPIEVLRVIHSFDPCLSCAVHVMRPNGKPVVVHQGNTFGREA
jgi:hydrogenase large subunit